MTLAALPLHVVPAVSLYADGGTVGGSPGRSIYWSVGTEGGVPLVREWDDTGRRRWSDEAEYLALHAALKIVLQDCKHGDTALVHMDCRPVVRHIRTNHTPRSPRCRPLYWQCIELLERIQERGVQVVLKWVKRQEVVERLGH